MSCTGGISLDDWMEAQDAVQVNICGADIMTERCEQLTCDQKRGHLCYYQLVSHYFSCLWIHSVKHGVEQIFLIGGVFSALFDDFGRCVSNCLPTEVKLCVRIIHEFGDNGGPTSAAPPRR